MSMHHTLPMSLAAAALCLATFTISAPAMAASNSGVCLNQSNPPRSLVEQMSDDDETAQIQIDAMGNRCAPAAMPSASSHRSEIVLVKPLPAKLRAELKPYTAS